MDPRHARVHGDGGLKRRCARPRSDRDAPDAGEPGDHRHGEGRRRADHERGVHLSRAEQRGCVRLRAVGRVPPSEVHGERKPGLPREHGIRAGAVAAPPEGGQRAPRGAVQRLGERHQGFRPGRIGRNEARLAVSDDRHIARRGHAAGQFHHGPEALLHSRGTALHSRPHHFQAVHLVGGRDRHAAVRVGGTEGFPHVHGDQRAAVSALGRRQAARLHGVAGAVPRIARARVHRPEHEEIGALADFAEGGAGASAALSGEHGRRGRRGEAVDGGVQPVCDRHAFALRFAGDVAGEINERALRSGEESCGLAQRSLERRGAAVHACLCGHDPVAEPCRPEGAGVAGVRDAILFHDDRDVVAGTPAPEAGDVRDGAIGHALCASWRSTSRYSRAARCARAAKQAAASRPRAKIVQIGSRGAK